VRQAKFQGGGGDASPVPPIIATPAGVYADLVLYYFFICCSCSCQR